MQTITDAINILFGLVIASGGLRAIYLAIKIIEDPDSKDLYFKKLKTTVVATIVGVSVFTIRNIAIYYFR